MIAAALGTILVVIGLVCAHRRVVRSRIAVLENEIAALRRTGEELRNVQLQQQAVLDNIPDLIWLKDAESRFLFANEACCSACGLRPGELPGKTDLDIWPRELAEQFRRDDALVMESGAGKRVEESLALDGSETKWIETIKTPVYDAAGRVIGTAGIARDITERKRIQEIMIQTEKMVTVGGLAAGMAHELNNPLGAILQNTQNIRRRLSSGLPANKQAANEIGLDFALLEQYLERRGVIGLLGHITAAGDRAADIISNMMAFTRKGAATLEATPLSRVIDRALEMAACDYDLRKGYDFRNIGIVRDYDANLPPFVMNRAEIEQALLNIVKNAAQALAERDPAVPPRIILRTRRSGQYALIEVEDNGPGMPDHIAKRVFDPFFTTKEIGVGTGMGLPVAYALVVGNHHGRISVDSAPGKGARFTVSLPFSKEDNA